MFITRHKARPRARAIAALLVLLAGPAAAAPGKSLVIGTGGVTGVYYPAGAAICRMVNRDSASHGVACSARSTGGSIQNLAGLRERAFDLGVVQSDWQYHAFKGSSRFRDAGPFVELRALFSLHPEPFTVVARSGSGIASFDDLKGKRVNVGNPGSGQRATMEVVLAALGWSLSDFALATELKSSEQAGALCDDRIDAMVFTVGHPSGSIKEATISCDSVLVEVSGPAIDRLVEDNPYYRKATIPAGMYRGTDRDVATFGVGATVVTTADLPEEVAYLVVRAVFENFDRFRQLHPAFAALTREQMAREGLSAPLHPGAMRYFREAGLR